jgi:hypothetical protein
MVMDCGSPKLYSRSTADASEVPELKHETEDYNHAEDRGGDEYDPHPYTTAYMMDPLFNFSPYHSLHMIEPTTTTTKYNITETNYDSVEQI